VRGLYVILGEETLNVVNDVSGLIREEKILRIAQFDESEAFASIAYEAFFLIYSQPFL